MNVSCVSFACLRRMMQNEKKPQMSVNGANLMPIFTGYAYIFPYSTLSFFFSRGERSSGMWNERCLMLSHHSLHGMCWIWLSWNVSLVSIHIQRPLILWILEQWWAYSLTHIQRFFSFVSFRLVCLLFILPLWFPLSSSLVSNNSPREPSIRSNHLRFTFFLNIPK